MTSFNDNINIIGGFIKGVCECENNEVNNVNDSLLPFDDIFKYCGLSYDETKTNENFDLTEKEAHYYSDYILMHYYVKKNSESVKGWWKYEPAIIPYFACNNVVFCDKMLELYFDDFVRINKDDHVKILEFFSKYNIEDLFERFKSKYNFRIYVNSYTPLKENYHNPEKVFSIDERGKKTFIFDYTIYPNLKILSKTTNFDINIFKFNTLEKLTNIYHLPILDNIDLHTLTNLKHLQLNYKNYKGVIDFSVLPKLETLIINVELINESITKISTLTDLQIHYPHKEDDIEHEHYPYIGKMHTLKSLHIYAYHNNLDDEIVYEIMNLSNLKELNVLYSGIELDYANLINLEYLSTSRPDETIKYLSNLKFLECVMYSSKFPEYLKNLSNLETLKINGKIKIDIKNDFKNLPKLQNIEFTKEGDEY